MLFPAPQIIEDNINAVLMNFTWRKNGKLSAALAPPEEILSYLLAGSVNVTIHTVKQAAAKQREYLAPSLLTSGEQNKDVME
jgi:hypothetical protein